MILKTLPILALAASLSAQDILYYKFDSGCQGDVVNYATGAQAVGAGTLDTGGSLPAGYSSWEPNGQFGGALSGGDNNSGTSYYNRVRTGWLNPTVNGDITLAFWMRQRPGALGTSLSYIWGGAGSLRMFTNGIANTGLYQRVIVASGPNGPDLALATDVQTLAAAGWTHIALVIDSVAGNATWYINGAVDTVIPGVGPGQIAQSGEVAVGMHTTTTLASAYDLDDFILSNRAYPAAEILALSLGSPAGAGEYSSGVTAQCGSSSLSSTGRPVVGGSGFSLDITTGANGLYSIALGMNRCDFAGGTFPLPLDAGRLAPIANGCQILTSADMGSIDGGMSGNVSVPISVPNNPALQGFNVFAQAVLLDVPTVSVEFTNGIGIAAGF